MKRVVVVFTVALVVAFGLSSAFAQGPGGFRGGGFGGPGGGPGFGGPGFGGPGGDMLGLLNNDQVKQEIELVPSQEEDLRKLGEGMREEMMAVFRDMRDASPEERQEIFTKLRESREDMEEQLERILLPHQFDRLRQISTQQQMRARGGAGFALAGGTLAEQLNLTEDQISELREKSQKLQEEMREKIEQLRKEAEQELLQTLTPQQRAKWEEMIGEPFDLQAPQRGRGFGGPGTAPERGPIRRGGGQR